MPTVNTNRSHVRLDLDFTDTDAPYALIQRIDAATGAPTVVRAHGQTTSIGSTAYANMYAGYRAVLYDVECPLDTAFYYTATAPSAALNANTNFSGGYIEPFNSAAPFAVSALAYSTAVQPTTGWYMTFHGDGSTGTPICSSELVPCTPGATITSSITYSTNATVTSGISMVFVDANGTGLSGFNDVASTNGARVATATGTAPANTAYVQLLILMQGTPPASTIMSITKATISSAAATATSGPVVVPSLGACWLKDPLRPANNVRVDFWFDPNPLCVPAEGVFFQSLDVETMPANSASFNVNNQAEPVIVSKRRSSDTSTLNLVSRTFADRDRLRALLTPGSPLLWQVPDEYGSPDRYLSVANATITRTLPDHRFPIRVFALPFSVTLAPAGPGQGVFGARWQDTSDVYATWSAVNAASITWTQVLDGVIG